MIYTELASGVTSNSSTTCSVTVLQSALIAHVTPTGSRLSLAQDSVTLSASGSYDPDDTHDFDNEESGLQYSWACERRLLSGEESTVTDTDDLSCWTGANSAAVLTGSELIYYTPNDIGLDLYELVFTLTVSKDTRESSAQVSFTFSLTEIPQVSLTASSASLSLHSTHNPQDVLSFQSSVEGYASDRLNYSWSVVDSTLELADLVLDTQLYTDLSSPSLVLGPDVLLPGATYVFKLTVTVSEADYLDPGWAFVTVETNAPPALGSCTVDLAPDALSASVLLCSGWTDRASDLPLQYRFGYISPESGMLFYLTTFQSLPSASVLLPVGTLDIRVIISDNKLAETMFWLPEIEVIMDLESEVEDLEATMEMLLQDSSLSLAQGNLDSFSQLSALTVSLLTLPTFSSSMSSSSSHTAAQARLGLLNLTNQLFESSSSVAVSELVVSNVAGITEDPSQLSAQAQLYAVDLLVGSVGNLAGQGLLQMPQAELSVFALSQVLVGMNDETEDPFTSSELPSEVWIPSYKSAFTI